MSAQTSIDAYQEIKMNGLLGRRQFQVYEALYLLGPSTQMEVVRHILAGEDATDHGFTPRFAELERMGAIVKSGEKHCDITGRNVIAWAVTGTVPVKLEKAMTNKEKIAFLRATLEIATEAMRKNGLVDVADEVTKNIEIVDRG